MYSFHDILATVEELRLGPLDLAHEASCEILHHNAVRACEEAKDILNKVALPIRQLFPVLHVLAEVNLLSSPENGHVILVHGPNVGMANGEDNETILIGV